MLRSSIIRSYTICCCEVTPKRLTAGMCGCGVGGWSGGRLGGEGGGCKRVIEEVKSEIPLRIYFLSRCVKERCFCFVFLFLCFV